MERGGGEAVMVGVMAGVMERGGGGGSDGVMGDGG